MKDAAAREHGDTETVEEETGLRVPFSAPAARRRLTTLVIAKLTLDLFFVAALAVGSNSLAFHPYFGGSLDYADGQSVRGWVVDRAQPDSPVEVQLYLDGRFLADGLADKPRPDVSERGLAPDERHGFVFNFEPPLYGEHEMRAYAAHTSRGGLRRTLQQIGPSLHFAAR
jgi:hypothetical protein